MFDLNSVKGEYYNRRYGGEIGSDFIEPCLSLAKYYRRNLGSFSSQSLKWYISSIQHFINNDVRIEILCHPQIDNITHKVLVEMENEEKRNNYINNEIIDKQLLKAAGIRKNDAGLKYGWQENFLCYLVANEILEIRFAVPLGYIKPKDQLSEKYMDVKDLAKNSYKNSKQGVSDELLHTAQFHTKLGYFKFKDGRELTFNGSANESKNAYEDSIESIDVWKGWETDFEKNKILTHKKNLQEDWDCTTNEDEKNLCFRTFKMGEEAFSLIRSRSPNSRPYPIDEKGTGTNIIDTPKEVLDSDLSYKYRHQEEAVAAFIKKEKGILEMATGTGKTRTACKIINELFKANQIDQFIVTLNGKDLLLQWYDIFLNDKEVESERLFNQGVITLKDKPNSKIMRDRFILNPKNCGLVISVNDVHNVLSEFDQDTLSRTLLIFDEVHDIGTELKLEILSSLTKKTGFCLGLSATPYKGEHKEDMTKGIFDAIGGGDKPIYEFGLEDAIQGQILCEFNYDTIEYELSEDDHAELKKKRSMLGGGVIDGVVYTPADAAMKIAEVYKKTETKLEPFEDFLSQNQDLLKSTIVFVANKKYGYKVCEILHKYSANYNIYYDDTTRHVLDSFAKNEIDILVTCEAISQGIDIPSLKNIVLFSANKEKRQSIQRLGRCLRNPNNNNKKVARVIDFWQIPINDRPSFDEDRVNWMTKLSQTKGEPNAK